MFEEADDESTDVRKSEFAVRTPAMAKAFFAITAAALILAAVFNFTMAGHRSTLIAEKAVKRAEQADREQNWRRAIEARKQLSQARPQPFPQTGSVQWKQVYPAGTRTTLLTIEDKTGDGLHKIIRIEDEASRVHVANLYLQANTRAYISLPTTLYSLSLSEGDRWLGPTLDFGPQASYQPIAQVNLLREYNLELRFSEK